jgi:hypothetical protein
MGGGREPCASRIEAGSRLSVQHEICTFSHELQGINGVRRKHGVMRVDMVQSNSTAELSYRAVLYSVRDASVYDLCL